MKRNIETMELKNRLQTILDERNTYNNYHTYPAYKEFQNFPNKQNVFWNAGALYYRTFEGSDWLITGNYGKVIKSDLNQVGLLSSSIGQISKENFLNMNLMYGYSYPIKIKDTTINLQTFVSYTIFS